MFMKELYPMFGIITTVLTPFKPVTKEVDWPSYKRGIKTALDAGVSGFLVPCNASEIHLLTHDEMISEVKEAVSIASGKALVIPSVSAPTREERLRQCKEYLELGVDGINLNMPYIGDEDYTAMVKDIDDMKPPFLCIQDASKVDDGLPDALIVKLFEEFESVRCIKIEVKDSCPKYTRILKATGGRMNVSGAFGSPQSIEAYDRGIHALMPTGLFELFVNVYDLYHKKSRNAAMKLFFDMLPIISFTRQGDLNLYFHKLYLKRIGVFEDTLCRKEYHFDEYHRRYAEDLIEYAIKLRDNLPSYWA
jgi:dihydrodipicolinate synthase/N-acetylneuraminate lyase